mgnify:CR=1 FL=1
MKLLDSIATEAASIIAVRRDIHAHPELCFQEQRTADVVAGKLAEILGAEKLIMLTNTPGVLDKNGELLTGLTPKQIDDLLKHDLAFSCHHVICCGATIL